MEGFTQPQNAWPCKIACMHACLQHYHKLTTITFLFRSSKLQSLLIPLLLLSCGPLQVVAASDSISTADALASFCSGRRLGSANSRNCTALSPWRCPWLAGGTQSRQPDQFRWAAELALCRRGASGSRSELHRCSFRHVRQGRLILLSNRDQSIEKINLKLISNSRIMSLIDQKQGEGEKGFVGCW